MIIVRFVTAEDLPGVLMLAELAYPGMTTLPPDRAVLQAKIEHAQRSLSKEVVKPNDELYFLVMEDTSTGQLVGTAAIIACLGAQGEFYSYKLNKVTQSCKELDKKITFETLNLSNHFEGFAEVASLYLHPDFRKDGNGKFLARSRYLFMAQFRHRFPESVMADIRGFYDEQGRSSFWQAVGQHFFDMEFAEADLYGATNGNQFIADLMPKHPLYVNMLPASAQAVIGKPNEKSRPAYEMLKKEGFRWNGHVDIFDASPSIDTHIDDMSSVRDSHQRQVALGEESQFDQSVLLANQSEQNFRVGQIQAKLKDQQILINQETMNALALEVGDSARVLVVD